MTVAEAEASFCREEDWQRLSMSQGTKGPRLFDWAVMPMLHRCAEPRGTDTMKERLQHLLSEVGESFDYLRSDVRNLSRYMAELEELIELYHAFAANATLSTPVDRAAMRKLL